MQSILTAAIEFVFVGSAILFTTQFLVGLSARRPSAAPALPAAEVAEAETAAEQPTIALTDSIVPFVRPQPKTATVAKMDWQSLNPYQLRTECSLQGIKWRNAHGKNKHLTKAQMVAALEALSAAA